MTPEELMRVLKAEAERRGYRFEHDDSTETVRVVRPDGTTAISAKGPKATYDRLKEAE